MDHTGHLFDIIKKYDSDNKGTLTNYEMVKVLRGYNIVASIDDIYNAKNEVGIDKESEITLSDLAKIITSNVVGKLMNRNMMKIFNKMDCDGDSIVSKQDFNEITRKYFINNDIKDLLTKHFNKSDVLTLRNFIDLMNDV